MSSLINYFLWGGDPNSKNPVTGLSKRDIYYIKNSWNKLHRNPIENGMHVFVKIFTVAPAAQNMFVFIQGLPEHQYREVAQFKSHVLHFMDSLNTAVNHITEPEVVIPLMHKLGVTHKRMGVKRVHFDVVTQVLVDILRNEYHANNDIIASWRRFLAFIYRPIFDKLGD